jgi:two-component system response regulator AlgR
MTLQVLVVDDEPLARSRLRTLLADCTAPAAMVAAEAGNAVEAMEHLRRRSYDAVLLDIHMPGADGLALAQAMRVLAQPPAVVFVTAHAEHAVQAFELEAADYLTKPVRLERLQVALQKVERLMAAGRGLASDSPEETLLIQDRGRTERVPLAEVLYFKAELKYVTVRTATREHLVEESLSRLEQEFADQFVRIHRSCLVAKAHITGFEKEIAEAGESRWTVMLSGLDEKLPVSRRQQHIVKEFGRNLS